IRPAAAAPAGSPAAGSHRTAGIRPAAAGSHRAADRRDSAGQAAGRTDSVGRAVPVAVDRSWRGPSRLHALITGIDRGTPCHVRVLTMCRAVDLHLAPRPRVDESAPGTSVPGAPS